MSFLFDQWKKLRSSSSRNLTTEEMAEILTHAFGNNLLSSSKDLDSNKGWLFAANRQVCGRASNAPKKLVRIERVELESGHVLNRRIPIHVHPFLDLLNKPNTDETGLVFHWRQVLSLQTSGRVFVAVFPEVLDVRSRDGRHGKVYTRISQMRILESDRMMIEASDGRAAGTFKFSAPGGGVISFKAAPSTPYERAVWKRDPYRFVFQTVMPGTRGYEGQSPSEAGRVPADNLERLGRLYTNQLKLGTHSGLIFNMKVGTEDEGRFRAMMTLLHAGLENAGSAMFLPADRVTVQPSPSDNQKMQFAELSKASRQEALGVAGASDSLVGLVDSTNRATVWGQEHILAIGTVDPLNGLLADAYNCWLLPLFPGMSDTSRLVLSYESAKMVDEKDRAEVLKVYVEAGIKSPNEARSEIGMDPKPGGDSLVSTDHPGPNTAIGNETSGEATSTEASNEDRIYWDSFSLGRDYMTDEGRRVIMDGMAIRTSALSSALEEEVRSILDATERDIISRANRISIDEYTDVIEVEGFDGIRKEKRLRVDDLLDSEVLTLALRSSVLDVLTRAATASANDTMVDAGLLDRVPDIEGDITATLDTAFAESISYVVHDVLNVQVSNVVAGKASAVQFLGRVSEEFDVIRGEGLLDAVNIEINKAESLGAHIGMQLVADELDGIEKVWLSSNGCHPHVDGQLRDLTDTFAAGDDGGEVQRPVECKCRSVILAV